MVRVDACRSIASVLAGRSVAHESRCCHGPSFVITGPAFTSVSTFMLHLRCDVMLPLRQREFDAPLVHRSTTTTVTSRPRTHFGSLDASSPVRHGPELKMTGPAFTSVSTFIVILPRMQWWSDPARKRVLR